MHNQHIDWSIMEQYKTLDVPGEPSLVDELIQRFHDSFLDRTKIIERAINEDDPVVISRQAHALKNSCGNVGALQMMKLCADLEYFKENGRDPVHILSALRSEYELVCEQLKSQ